MSGFELTGLDDLGEDDVGEDIRVVVAAVIVIVFSFTERLGTTDGAGDTQERDNESDKVDPLEEATDVSFPPVNVATAAVVASVVDAVAAAIAALLTSLASATEVMCALPQTW